MQALRLVLPDDYAPVPAPIFSNDGNLILTLTLTLAEHRVRGNWKSHNFEVLYLVSLLEVQVLRKD